MIDDTMARLNSPTEILAVKKIDPTKEISVTVFIFILLPKIKGRRAQKGSILATSN